MRKSKRAARNHSVTSTSEDERHLFPVLEKKMSGAIESTGVAEVIRSESIAGQIELKCRVHDEKTWLPIITFILQEEQRSGKWQAHVCQFYFLLNKTKLVYTWNLTFGSNELEATVDELCRIVGSMAQSIRHFSASQPKVSPPKELPQQDISDDQRHMRRVREDPIPGAGIDSAVKGQEVVEVPLVGVTANRNQPSGPVWQHGGRKSKGAHLIGSKRNQYQ